MGKPRGGKLKSDYAYFGSNAGPGYKSAITILNQKNILEIGNLLVLTALTTI